MEVTRSVASSGMTLSPSEKCMLYAAVVLPLLVPEPAIEPNLLFRCFLYFAKNKLSKSSCSSPLNSSTSSSWSSYSASYPAKSFEALCCVNEAREGEALNLFAVGCACTFFESNEKFLSVAAVISDLIWELRLRFSFYDAEDAAAVTGAQESALDYAVDWMPKSLWCL